MIAETTVGRELFDEVSIDYIQFVKKELKKCRELLRKPYMKTRKTIPNMTWHEFSCRSQRNNLWYMKTGIVGNPALPNVVEHYHINTNAGPNGSRLCIIYRGTKAARRDGNPNGGYVVSVLGSALDDLRKIYTQDDDNGLVERVFSGNEEGIYFDYDWTKYYKKSIPEDTIPVMLKTTIGVFLSFSSTDRSEVRLVKFIKSNTRYCDINNTIKSFLEPAWVCYNSDRFSNEYVREVRDKLMEYMKDKEDKTVYRLAD